MPTDEEIADAKKKASISYNLEIQIDKDLKEYLDSKKEVSNTGTINKHHNTPKQENKND